MRKFGMNDEAFTGLEAAIVLIAFVVVAAVFSYVMLGAGFFTSQKSQEVVHTSVAQASSSMDVAGSVIAKGGSNELNTVSFYLQLTAGGSPADVNKTAYAITTQNKFGVLTIENNTALASIATVGKGLNITWTKGDGDWLLESGEMAQVTIDVSGYDIKANNPFTIDVKPSVGAALPVARLAPPGINSGEIYELN
jgi:flagellin FlaB